jgi:hypothetical protein
VPGAVCQRTESAQRSRPEGVTACSPGSSAEGATTPGSESPTTPSPNRGDSKCGYHLGISFLISGLRIGWHLFGWPVDVSVGFADGASLPGKDGRNIKVNLVVVPPGPFTLWLLFFALILIVFLVLAVKSNLLRDAGPTPTPGERLPYSLARVQAAWWFFLVLAAYLLIGLIMRDFIAPLTGTVLAQLGISAGTAVGSAFVDKSKATPADDAKSAQAAQDLNTQATGLTDKLKEAEEKLKQAKENETKANATDVNAKAKAQSAASDAKTDMDTLSSAIKEKESLLKRTRGESEQFILDILSDANGVTFHRFQIVAWTLTLGIIFVYKVYQSLAMPDFDPSLLALMGISSGTYLGMKIPEATVPKT